MSRVTTTRFRPDRPTIVLLASLFVVMVGYGSTLTVLPDHIQRVGGLGAAAGSIAFHVGLIVGVYALAGLLASPVVGRLGDRRGRRPILLAGLGGLAATQVLFGLSTSLWMLYPLRLLGGLADASLLVTASAYIADTTSDRDRPRGMAWFGTAVSLGLVAGPALTEPLTGSTIELGGGIVHLDGHSIPFLFSGLLPASVLVLAGRHLPSSTPVRPRPHIRSTGHQHGLRPVVTTTWPLLVLVLAAQYGLAIFEGIFVLYARNRLSLDLAQIGLAFMVCGAVLAAQLPAVDWLTARLSSETQVAFGFAIMGASLGGLLLTGSFPLVLGMAAAHGAGGAVVIPNLSALVSSRTRSGAGLALGLKNSASGLGQFLGPLIGGSLMGLRTELPFLAAGALLMSIALTVPRAMGSGKSSSTRPHRPDRVSRIQSRDHIGGTIHEALEQLPQADVAGRDLPTRSTPDRPSTRPEPISCRGVRGPDRGHRSVGIRGEVVIGPKIVGSEGHQTEHIRLHADQGDIGQAATAERDRGRPIQQHLAPIMNRPRDAPRPQRHRRHPGQPRGLGGPLATTARPRRRQATRGSDRGQHHNRATHHLRSAFHASHLDHR